MILAGDIGGTKTILALFEGDGRGKPVVEETFPSREHPSFDEIVETFVARHRPRVARACVGVAGPVKDERCEATNLPWVVDARDVAKQLGIPRAFLLNDLEAYAHGIAVLGPEDIYVLSQGAADAEGNRAVIAAGTGLGEAGLFWDGATWHPFGTEGGHADFAPRDELEIELLRFLLKQHGRVSWERLVSGMGLVNIYRFFRETGREEEQEEPPWLAEAMRTGDPGAVIARHARDGRSPLCARTLTLFMTLYGAEAGDFALKVMARGGVYVGGGIAAKNLDALKEGSFMRRFTSKGRLSPVLEAMAVRVILNEKTGLLGAAQGALLRSRAAG
jgi:glucokinase